MSDWEHKHRSLTFNFNGYRPGWRGVWDHAVEIATRRDPLLIPQKKTVQIEFWIKASEPTVDISDAMVTVQKIARIDD